jgi:UDP-N-acetylenolpyruvoylglucosamine reductase
MKKLLAVAILLPILSFSYEINFNKSFSKVVNPDLLTTNINISVEKKDEKSVNIEVEKFNNFLKNTKNITIKNNTILVGSSVNLQQLIQESFKNNLTGLEWAAGIPGTIGGAIFGNSGSFNGDISSITETVKIFNTETKETEVLSNLNCNFKYRNSIFKENQNKYIIIEAELKLNQSNLEELEKAKNIFKENITKKINKNFFFK